MTSCSKIFLKPGKEQPLLRYHPWIFSGAIDRIQGTVTEGDFVEVYAHQGQFLALGHYYPGSIAVKIFAFEAVKVNIDFWKQKLQRAVQLRRDLGLLDNPHTNLFRLIHAEGDDLPGLVIDYYNGTLVLQFHSAGMYRLRDLIVQLLTELLAEQLVAIFDKSQMTLAAHSNIKSENKYLFGKPTLDQVLENGLLFKIDWEQGQKTGFFIDQRENRQLIEHYALKRRVLNLFCYSGGFSVYALRGGAQWVHSVDSAQQAIQLTDNNIALNFDSTVSHRSFVDEAFNFLTQNTHQYDLIILDPPAFAKHNNTKTPALHGYRQLNRKVFEQIQSGGILFTFSCSQVISREDFRKTIFTAAAQAKRRVKILHQLTQSADHPINIFHPEGDYLKGLVLHVH